MGAAAASVKDLSERPVLSWLFIAGRSSRRIYYVAEALHKQLPPLVHADPKAHAVTGGRRADEVILSTSLTWL
jgi:hypothetical protein